VKSQSKTRSARATTFKGRPKSFPNAIKLYQNSGIGYISEQEISQNIDLVDKYKVFIPRAGSGSDSFPHSILGRPFVVGSNTACTETYMIAGVFDNEIEAENLVAYISTRFFRFLVLLLKISQDAPSRVYSFVPIQDFTESWTDEKLYKKYGLAQKEIEFIESMIRPMELEGNE
jgi:site-specific DNA-methyltransferase (adenine-specific)